MEIRGDITASNWRLYPPKKNLIHAIFYGEKNSMNTATQQPKSPFNSYIQLNKVNMSYVRDLAATNPIAMQVWLFLIENMDEYNAVICSYKVLEEVLGVSNRSIARAISYLKDNGFLHIEKTGTSNVYIANKELVWNSWANNLKFCKFPANVVLSYSEQDKDYLQKEVKKTKTEEGNFVEIVNNTKGKK